LPRILFVKTSSLGDVVHNCPAVSDVARCVPGAVIDWMVEEPFAAIAQRHAAVRRAIPVAVRRWRRELWNPWAWREMRALRRTLAAEPYDFVLDTQGLAKSALLCGLAKGEKHGMDRDSAREAVAARAYDVVHAIARGQHAVARNRQLAAAALGYAPPERCDYGLRAEPAAAPGREVVLLTMSSRDDKLWPEERWVALARALGERGLGCILPWGSGRERERCARIAANAAGARIAERLSIAELIRIFARARGVVGVDTGLSHLAVAAGAAVVGVFCATDPARTGLYGGERIRNLGAPGAPPATASVLAAVEAFV